jgi:hypothetical protein
MRAEEQHAHRQPSLCYSIGGDQADRVQGTVTSLAKLKIDRRDDGPMKLSPVTAYSHEKYSDCGLGQPGR